MIRPELWRRLLAEFAGTLLLVTAVVGSGIMAAVRQIRDAVKVRVEQLLTELPVHTG